jgi:glyoxylase-like metal-dependent hydrolase (beta-lactamase superfamily II)
MNVIPLSWTVLSDGWTEAPEAIVIQGGSWRRKLRMYATAHLLMHPQAGPILMDTGYSNRFLMETKRFPARLYRWITPVTLSEPGGIAALLRRQGIEPEQIRHLVISHFHADHLGGLRDFPQARFYCSAAAWQHVRGLRGFAAVRQAFFPGELPDDFESRLQFIDEESDFVGDGSIQVLSLPGHAVGQIGLRFHDGKSGPVLLPADACWISTAYRENRMPHPITKILHSWEQYRRTLQRLHDLHRAEPDLIIAPTHCPETAQRIAIA